MILGGTFKLITNHNELQSSALLVEYAGSAERLYDPVPGSAVPAHPPLRQGKAAARPDAMFEI